MKDNFNTPDYIIGDGLRAALDGAIKLHQPLLLTGEPGTGKTTLAKWAVQYLNHIKNNSFNPEPLEFITKTTSSARDLFYTYDALAHFQSANVLKNDKNTSDFIELQALGLAIAMSNPEIKGTRNKIFRTEIPEDAKNNSVVLIDEVDKAPRDFTNDILDEIDKQRFRVREQDNFLLEKGSHAEIVVILTSNSEKNLPDAFLRRCAFFHIEFPKKDDPLLRQIVELHVGKPTDATQAAYDYLFDYFYELRDKTVRKKPATAELIGWLRLLSLDGFFDSKTSAQQKQQFIKNNLSFLVKTREDLDAVKNISLKL